MSYKQLLPHSMLLYRPEVRMSKPLSLRAWEHRAYIIIKIVSGNGCYKSRPSFRTNGPVIVWRLVERKIQKTVIDGGSSLDLEICHQECAVALVDSWIPSRHNMMAHGHSRSPYTGPSEADMWCIGPGAQIILPRGSIFFDKHDMAVMRSSPSGRTVVWLRQ